jgi:hypothetical protein
MRIFEMIRDEDPSGVSGTGPVGQVVEFDNGWVAVSFYLYTANVPNVIVYSSLEDAHKIHGHKGLTRFEWVNNTDEFVAGAEWKPASGSA